MKHLIAGAIAILLAMPGLAADQLQSREVLSGKVKLLVPAGFRALSDAEKRVKYPGANAPTEVLSSDDTTINIAFAHKDIQLKQDEVADLEQPIRAQMVAAKFNSSGVRRLNGRNVLVLDFETAAQDGTIRNVMAMTSLEGRLLVISYNCMIGRDANCGDVGTRLIESIELTPKPAP